MTAAMKSRHGVVLPAIDVLLPRGHHGPRHVPDADDDVQSVPTQAARQPAHVPRPGHPQLLLGDQHARARCTPPPPRGQPGERAGNHVVVLAVHPLTQQVVRSEALGTMPATRVEHPHRREASTRASNADWIVDVPVFGRPTCRWMSAMPTRVAPVGAQWQGTEDPVYSGMSDSSRGVRPPLSPRPGRSERWAAGGGVAAAVSAGPRPALLEERLLARSHPAGLDPEGASASAGRTRSPGPCFP